MTNTTSETFFNWHEPYTTPFHLAGFPWFDQDHVYRRFPVKLSEPIPDAVNSLADCTAGGQIRLQSNSKKVALRMTLAEPADMHHMPPSGQCGFDLYMGAPGYQRHCGTLKYDNREREQTEFEPVLFEQPEAEMRNFTINFPLYKGVKEVFVGLDEGAEISPPPAYALDGRIVIYGTSITQGGCASRPGMAYTNILSRDLNMEIINLGFSGNGRGEPEVARLVAQVPNPRMFVLDYEANTQDDAHLGKTLPEFYQILRSRHRDAPILILSRIPYAWNFCLGERLRYWEACRRIQAQFVDTERKNGDTHIYFHDCSKLLGDDYDECSVDGVHPTDLGFHRMAKGLEPVFRKILYEPEA